jgi:hypothetical protein
VTIEINFLIFGRLTSLKSQRVAIFFSPSPQGEDERIYEKIAEMEELYVYQVSVKLPEMSILNNKY